MPLTVDIKINDQLIETIRITRTEALRGHNQMHEYIAQVIGKPEHVATFHHYYNQGAQECVLRALEALAQQKERRERRGR